LKLGSIRPSYFAAKYGEDVVSRYREQLSELTAEGFLTNGSDRVTLTREGLLRVDSLLPRFFKPEHAAVRYT
jgi:oxygen-independent coproporphyrinogen-3 oxidase